MKLNRPASTLRTSPMMVPTVWMLSLGIAVAAEAPHPRRSPLADVTPLDRPVTYTETKIPLVELVQKVAADTGVKLTATPEVADEPVAVVVKDLPARRLLEEVADLLDYQWSRRAPRTEPRTPNAERPTPSFEIHQDLAARQREEASRQAARTAAEKRLKEEISRYGEIAKLPPAEIQALREEGERRTAEAMKLSPEQQAALFRSAEWQEKGPRYDAATKVAPPIQRAIAGLLARLSPQQWATLRSGQTLVLANEPGPGEARLPAETGALFHASPFPDSPPGVILQPNPEPQQEALNQVARQALQAEWAAATGYRVGIRLDVDRFESSGVLFLNANAAPAGPAAPGDPFSFGPGSDLWIAAGPADPGQMAAENTSEQRAAWEKDPVLGRKEPFTPSAKPRVETLGAIMMSGPRVQMRDLLPDLARTYHVQFLSDAYWSTGLYFGPPPSSRPQPLFERLQSGPFSAWRWDRQGDLVRLRSRNWFLERPREIPLRFVRRWKESYERDGGLSLAQYLEMVTGLRDVQLLHAPDVVTASSLPPEARELFMVYAARHALRLIASLSAAPRQALLAGRPLSLAETGPPQRELFLLALQGLQRDRPGQAALAADHLGEAVLSVSSRQFQRLQGGPPGGPFGGFGPPPPAPGPPPAPAPGGKAAPPPGPPPVAPGDPASPRPPSPRPAAPRQAEQWEFTFAVPPSLRQSLTLTAAVPASPAPFERPNAERPIPGGPP